MCNLFESRKERKITQFFKLDNLPGISANPRFLGIG
jgi:hypothetical protein